MSIRETEVRSLGELIDRVTPEKPDPVTGRRRDACVYHGSADASRSLLTSLDRLGGVQPAHTKPGLEEHILRHFARYSRPRNIMGCRPGCSTGATHHWSRRTSRLWATCAPTG